MEKKSNKKKFIILGIIIAIIAIIGITIGIFAAGKLSKINFKELKDEELDVNSGLYDELEGKISIEEFKNLKKIVLLGMDNENPEYKGDQGRTDTIMICGINTETKQLKIISIPRDTYVDIEGHEKNKINYAYAFGKEQLTIKTINQNFGLDLNEYVTINFTGLINVINRLGGIELTISKEEMQYINGASYIAYGVSGNKRQVLNRYGTITLDGEQALTHSRDRKVGDDFTRAGRQRKVLEAIMNKIIKMDVGKINETLDMFLEEVTTNINISEYMKIISDVLVNKSTYMKSITSAQVPTREYAKDKYIDGIYYFVPDNPEDLKTKMIEYLYLK